MARLVPNVAPSDRRHNTARLFHDSRQRRVGLIGGSFNPAHAGHLHMAKLAKRILRLDEVWFLVTPQNPLKPLDDMATVEVRMDSARTIAAQHRFIKVICPEASFRSTYTYNTLNLMKKFAPKMQFTWIMGADNLAQLFAWKKWQWIKCAMPIAVIDRPSYSYTAICAGRKLNAQRVSPPQMANRGKGQSPRKPIWCFIAGRRHHASATALRALQRDS